MADISITESIGASGTKTEIVIKTDSKSAGVIVAIFNGSYSDASKSNLDFKEMIINFCRELIDKQLIKNIPSVRKLIAVAYQPILDLQYAFSQARKISNLNLDAIKLTEAQLKERDARINDALHVVEVA